MRAENPGRVTVVGSINRDLSVRVRSIPVPGQTVPGGDHVTGPGGKGANQAVAAARLGARVRMVGRVGPDGEDVRANLAVAGVDVAAVRASDRPTGLAIVVVAESGENTVVVSPGANADLEPADLPAELGGPGDVLLTQFEVPEPVVAAAVRRAHEQGAAVVLNPAPMRPISRTLLADVDVLTPNATELGALLDADEPVDARAAAALLDGAARADRAALPPVVVVTLGAAGALVWRGTGDHVPVAAPVVRAVDTVGAGDTLCGALAAALAAGDDVVTASRRAVVAAAIAVTHRGAQGGMPTSAEVDAFMGDLGASQPNERTRG